MASALAFSPKNIARLARTLGLPMREVRAMTLRDVDAMVSVLKDERNDAERRRQAQKNMRRAPRGG